MIIDQAASPDLNHLKIQQILGQWDPLASGHTHTHTFQFKDDSFCLLFFLRIVDFIHLQSIMMNNLAVSTEEDELCTWENMMKLDIFVVFRHGEDLAKSVLFRWWSKISWGGGGVGGVWVVRLTRVFFFLVVVILESVVMLVGLWLGNWLIEVTDGGCISSGCW